MYKNLNPETAPLNDLLENLGERCHEGVQLGCNGWGNDWVAEVCSTSSRQAKASPDDDEAFFNGPAHKTPDEAVRALYRIYVDPENGCGSC